jgi:aromatic-L-amino-acid decarboxylase
MTLSAYGSDAFGAIVDKTCALAQRLAARIAASNRLSLAAPTPLNIVCFRINGFSDAQTEDLVANLQEDGAFAPSTTIIDGRLAIRAAIVNHRTDAHDVDGLVEEILRRVD